MRNPEGIAALRRAMGAPPRPSRLTQEPLDYDDEHLHRLLGLAPDESPRPGDIWEYTQDVRFRPPIQSALLVHLLPHCLACWREDLHGWAGWEAFVEHFYPVLADCRVFEQHLTPEQGAAVAAFMRQEILTEIDRQSSLGFRGSRASAYRWFGALQTYGVLRPDVSTLFRAWWRLESPARAVAALQYLSVLAYDDLDNPVFAPWTPTEGGGAPELWEYAGHLHEHRWLEPNVAWLQQELTESAAVDLLGRAASMVVDGEAADVASRMVADLPQQRALLAARCAELPVLLATRRRPDASLSWTR